MLFLLLAAQSAITTMIAQLLQKSFLALFFVRENATADLHSLISDSSRHTELYLVLLIYGPRNIVIWIIFCGGWLDLS